MKIQKIIPFLMFMLISCSQTATLLPAPTKLPSATNTFIPKATLTITKIADLENFGEQDTFIPTLTITPSPYPTQVYGLLTSPDGSKKSAIVRLEQL